MDPADPTSLIARLAKLRANSATCETAAARLGRTPAELERLIDDHPADYRR